jgi:hypothetical protein
MADYLGLVNQVLVKINEPVLTTATFTADRGIQTLVKDAVNDSIRDIIAAELQWPFNIASNTETILSSVAEYALASSFRTIDWNSFFIRPSDLVTNGAFASAITSWTDISAGSGSSAHTTDGDGRARLTGDGTDIGGITQSLATVAGKVYRVSFQMFNAGVTVKVGTTSGASNLYTEAITLAAAGTGQFETFTFDASTAASFISFETTSATAVDVDKIIVREELNAKPLQFLSLLEFNKQHRGHDDQNNPEAYNYPEFVYETSDGKFGLTPIPDQENYEVLYDYWTIPTDLSASTDSPVIPARYHDVIVARARYYALSLRSDPAFADRANKEFEEGVKRMRTELINTLDYMTGKALRSFYSLPATYSDITAKP